MAVSPDFLDMIMEHLEPLGGVASRRMFGGVGLRRRELFFGVIDDDVLYLKVDAETRPDFEAAGGEAFRPYKDHRTANYFTVPLEALEDPDLLVGWACKALEAAARAQAGKRPKSAN
jgi:DNA transformation protein and related proteins